MESVYNKIWGVALKKIAGRVMGSFELRQKLAEKFPEDEETILKVIEELERVLLLNDRRYAEEFVHHLIQKPIGRIKIMVETRRKGISEEEVDRILANYGWSEEKSAKKALKEKERLLREDDPRKRKFKLMNFLKSRGFKDETIYRVVR